MKTPYVTLHLGPSNRTHIPLREIGKPLYKAYSSKTATEYAFGPTYSRVYIDDRTNTLTAMYFGEWVPVTIT